MSAQSDYGDVIAKAEHYVVRLREKEDGTLQICIHAVKDGKEMLPRGYMVGYNYVAYEIKK